MQKKIKPLDRAEMIGKIKEEGNFDIIVIGAGATGLGVAADAASRGHSVLIVDGRDFCSGTSSRSTKLIHGGLRYLANPRQWSFIREAMQERRLLLQNAPTLVKPLRFAIPCFKSWEAAWYGLGVGLYSMFGAGGRGMGPMTVSGRVGALAALPGIRRKGLRAVVSYSDAQFDDARLGLALLNTATAYGAVAVNYMSVTDFTGDGRRITSVTLRDEETAETYEVSGKVIINCAGPWVDTVRRMADQRVDDLVRISRGSHIVVDRSFLPGANAMVIPHTDDKRIVFCVPWKGMLEIGTTDIEQGQAPFDVEPTSDEIEFLIANANRYLSRQIRKEDVQASFSGLRPLFSAKRAGLNEGTASLGRGHAVIPEFGNMLTVVGGKWTSYRAMAEDVLKTAAQMRFIPKKGCMTRSLLLLADETLNPSELELQAANAASADEIVDKVCAYARHCAKTNGARRAADVLTRRLRLGQMNQKRAAELTEAVQMTIDKTLSRGVVRSKGGRPRKRVKNL